LPLVKNGIPKPHDDYCLRHLYKFVFRLLGWKVDGQLPSEKKYILIVAPHTSNWDFLVGVGARAELNFWPRYAAKKELFVWPVAWLFRRLGGYPVERSKSTNFVQNFVDIFNKEEEFILTLTPEGTRSYNADWKTGFYYISKEANVPVFPVGFDYKTKTVKLGEKVWAKDVEVDQLVYDLKTWYSTIEGKNKEWGVRKPEEEKQRNV
jgi:1-acyl-sn-glycerol-3-phosphate acyltransferase